METIELVNLVEIRTDNPYSNGEVLALSEIEDAFISDFVLERKPIQYIKSENDRYYTITQGEKLTDIAYDAWGNSKLWWIIYDVNNLDFPFDIPYGTSLIIPDLDKLQIFNSNG